MHLPCQMVSDLPPRRGIVPTLPPDHPFLFHHSSLFTLSFDFFFTLSFDFFFTLSFDFFFTLSFDFFFTLSFDFFSRLRHPLRVAESTPCHIVILKFFQDYNIDISNGSGVE